MIHLSLHIDKIHKNNNLYRIIPTLHNNSAFKVVLLAKGKLSKTIMYEKVQVGKDQEKAQSEKDSHSKNRDGKN